MSLLQSLAEQKKQLQSTTESSEEIVQGVQVPIEIQLPEGTLRCYVTLSPKVLNSEGEFMSALEDLSKAFKLAIYKKQSSFGGFGNGGGFNRSSSFGRRY